MEQTIKGKVPSKSNCYKIVRIAGTSQLGKQDKLYAYEKSFYLQCNVYRNRRIRKLFELYLDVYFENQRPDLDNSLKVVLDCLQGCSAITNDRNCVKIEARKYIDRDNPRVEFTIVEV